MPPYQPLLGNQKPQQGVISPSSSQAEEGTCAEPSSNPQRTFNEPHDAPGDTDVQRISG